MKKFLVISFLIAGMITANAKYVKFAVDMTGQTISTFGVHVSGDFQTAAGYSGGNFQPNTTLLQKEGTTNIYSVIVKIPAFAKYEYFFVNGDQFYEAEFVPVESRPGDDITANRWIYVDSLANDTSFVGAVLFSGNAPKDLKLLRLKVNLKRETISSKGIHVAGDFQNWNTQNNILYSFVQNRYETIVYTDSTTTYQYKFYNGNTLLTSETVPTGCSNNNNRFIKVIKDTVLNEVCFSSCTICSTTGISSLNEKGKSFEIIPNPCIENALIILNETQVERISLFDMNGRWLKDMKITPKQVEIERGELAKGIYFIRVVKIDGAIHSSKIIFN